MLRKISTILLIALLLAAVPAGAALALPQGEEQVVKQEVIMGYFDVWKGNEWQDTNNDGSPDKPGQTGKVTKPFSYSAADKLSEYKLTRVEVKYPFSPDEYIVAGGRNYGPNGQPWIDPDTGETVMSLQKFREFYLTHLPQNLSVQIANHDLDVGKARVQWGLDLIPLEPDGTLNLKDPENRQYIGYEPANIGNIVEGWRWYLPGIITWYGKEKQLPDFSVAFDRHEIEEVNPGDKVELTATFTLNENHEQPETARLAAFHAVGEGEYPLALQPVDPSDALDADGIIEFSPGESKQFKVKATVQGRNSKILAKIWPAGGDDVNWSNNSDEAHIRLNQNLWVELVGSTEIETSEGNSVNLTARIHNDSGVMVVTRVIWKLDGKVIKDVSDFDVISHGDSPITINPGEGSHIITVEVNPDRNRPVDEATFDDNKANGSIYVAPALKEESGDVQIIGPDTWEALKPYPFTVKITGYLPYERYRDRDGRVRYRSKTYNMNVNTHGEGVLTIEWATHNQFGNPQKTKPVVKSWSESYSKSSGSFTKTINYEFPVVGMRGLSKSNLVIEATDSRFGTARKVVTINPAPVKRPGLQLTK